MSRRNTPSTEPFTQSGVASSSSSVYLNVVMILLAAIAITYHDTDPFKERRASLLIFIIATFCHAIALTTKTTCWLTTKLFHVSGATALYLGAPYRMFSMDNCTRGLDHI